MYGRGGKASHSGLEKALVIQQVGGQRGPMRYKSKGKDSYLLSKYQTMKAYKRVDKLNASATLSLVEDRTGDWLGHRAGLDVVPERK